MLIHRVIQGPMEDEDGNILCLCLVEDDGDLFDEELYFETILDAITFSHHFRMSIEPINLSTEGSDH